MQTRAIIRRATLLGGLLCFSTLVDPAARAQQAPTAFFSEPVLILGGGGHHAPVRSLIFSTADGSQLLSGGMDKVVHVWNLDADRSEPARTLRPPNWRAFRGQVNALALSPRDDGGNQRLLAVAGYGVLGDFGEILLFRYPGPTGQGTGDIEFQLPALGADGTLGPGHNQPVTSMAFTPDGRFLVSASNDRTVRIWDIAGRRQVAVLPEAQGEVIALALFANGTRLVTGGRDGLLRLYDITDRANPRMIAQAARNVRRPGDPLAGMILTLAASPDNRWIVVGTEEGLLIRHDAATLGGAVLLPNTWTGPVEAVTMNHDGSLLATSHVSSSLAAPGDFPTVSCVVEVRSMPGGQVVQRMPTTTNLVYSLAFGPAGGPARLAYSGGDAQAIHVKDLAPNSPPPDELKGSGASVWDVGIREDGRAIRFARTRPITPGRAAEYESFDLRGRHFFDPEGIEPPYRHAVASESGWTIRPVSVAQVDFVPVGGGAPRPGILSPTDERRWWSYTVIPPNAAAGHPDPVAAVGTDTGVALWNLTNGRRTRFFAGHAGSVYAMASSVDGRWLVTGSADQTVRLWSLNGCDRPAPYGARFEPRPDGFWTVAEVTTGGIAEGIGLKKGHVIEKFYVGIPPADPSLFLPRLDAEPPATMYSFQARMPGDPAPIRVGGTKRDSPALTLFPGIDRRWVLWTPRGHYDTSVDGDRRFLGWLTNRGTPSRLLAGWFDTIDKFEKKYRQPRAPAPNVLDRLLDTADPIGALAALPAADPAAADPTNSRADLAIRPVTAEPPGRPPVARQATIPVDYRAIAGAGAARVRRLWFEVNGRNVLNVPVAQPVQEAVGRADLPLGDSRDPVIGVVVEDERGVVRREQVVVSNQAPPPPGRRGARLEIIAIGAETFADKRFPSIPFARNDARVLANFLGERLVDPTTGARFAPERVHARPLLDREVAAGPIASAFDDLKKAAGAGMLGAEDVVAVVIESHYLEFRSQRLIATSEPDAGWLPPSLAAADLADRLGELAKLGCRVIVLVDAVHESLGPGFDNDIQEWVRMLQGQAGIITFVASDFGPSRYGNEGHRAFAQGVLDSLKAGAGGRLRKPGGPVSLFDFQRTVTESVAEKTGRKQHAQCYLPRTVGAQVPFLDPTPIPRR